MKYVITGGAGNISKPLATQLLSAGHIVRVISRTENNLKDLINLGAQTAIGSLEDPGFVRQTFEGADAVYTMCPPNLVTPDLKEFWTTIGRNFAEAIDANGIRFVVNLSSIGAHLTKGAGTVSALHHVEGELNNLQDVNIKHLRPAYFYSNLMMYISMIRDAGIIGSNYSNPGKRFPMSDTSDVAAVAAEELTSLDFRGHSIRYLASDEADTDEIAGLIGNAIGRPGLKWLTFSNEQLMHGLLQAGLSQEIARNYIELGNAMDSGEVFEEYRKKRPCRFGAVKLYDFMKVFATVYNSN